VIDDEKLDGRGLRREFQAELFLERFKDAEIARFGLAAGWHEGKFHRVLAGEAGAVDDGPVERRAAA